MRISVRDIQRHVAADFGVDLDTFYSPARHWEVCHPRQYAMLLARELTPLSVTILGRLFGRDHSTVSTGIQSAKKRLANDRNLALKLEARALLLTSERQKDVDGRFIGFPPKIKENPPAIHQTIQNHSAVGSVVDPQAMAA